MLRHVHLARAVRASKRENAVQMIASAGPKRAYVSSSFSRPGRNFERRRVPRSPEHSTASIILRISSCASSKNDWYRGLYHSCQLMNFASALVMSFFC